MNNVLDFERALLDRAGLTQNERSLEARLREAFLSDMPSDLADRIKQRLRRAEVGCGASTGSGPTSARALSSDGGRMSSFREPALSGVELWSVVGSRELHQKVHQGYSVVLLMGPEDLRMSWSCNGRVVEARCGDLQLFAPGDVEAPKEVSVPVNKVMMTWSPTAIRRAAQRLGYDCPRRFISSRLRSPDLELAVRRLFVGLSLDPRDPKAERRRSGIIMDSYELALHWVLSLGCAEGKASSQRADTVWKARTLLERSRYGQLELDVLCRRVKCSMSRLREYFRDETGVSIDEYRKLLQVRAARRKLMRGEGTKEVAEAMGLRSEAHLHHRFVRCEGVAPEAWRAMAEARRGGASLEAARFSCVGMAP